MVGRCPDRKTSPHNSDNGDQLGPKFWRMGNLFGLVRLGDVEKVLPDLGADLARNPVLRGEGGVQADETRHADQEGG